MKFGEGADPRLGGSEDLTPEYKISFWNGPHIEEGETVTEADADEVLAWAASNAGGRHYSVWVRTIVVDAAGKRRSDDVRLFGTDPPANDNLFPRWARRPPWH